MSCFRKPRSTSLPPPAVNKVSQRCFYYLKGKCRWGNFCKYVHKVQYVPKHQPIKKYIPKNTIPLVVPPETSRVTERLNAIRKALRKHQIEDFFQKVRAQMSENLKLPPPLNLQMDMEY